ncbi:hypothetical protein FA13DRAFT_1778401 [Coprinellus micaceus]|uniref:Uncharacterized protein n=1 Tax=Coprinellus micaceus TaxID=71717 RepID=A0A4Y7SNI0_COPMI|nr:hypothetical protein FA13DRAFT_1778401 [Coprinellus micaceus]
MSATASHRPRHESEMTMKWTELIVTWFWYIWYLLRSFAVLTKRRPPLPRSASHPELENGLFTFGASKYPRGTPSGKGRRGDEPSFRSHNDSTRPINIMDFQFTFENKVDEGPRDSSQGSLPSDSMASIGPKPKAPRRPRRSRESMDRRRQRRVGRVPDFVPPPEIHIEDWSDNQTTTMNQFLPSWQLPEFQLSSLSRDRVPFVIITPSTPSVEGAGVLNDLDMVAPLVPDPKSSPPHTASSPQTAPLCDQIAQVLAPDGSEESTPSLDNDNGHHTEDFTFTESLQAAAFGKQEAKVVSLDLEPEPPSVTELPLTLDPLPIPPPPLIGELDDSFQPSSNSTPRKDGFQPEATHDFQFDDALALNYQGLELPLVDPVDPDLSAPYTDIFDLDMYADLRASMAALGIYSSGDHRGEDVPPLPTLIDVPHSDPPPLPILARFSFAAPLNLPVTSGSEDTVSTPPGQRPSISSDSGSKRTGRSSGIYTLSGHFKFPPIQPTQIPVPDAPDSPDSLPLAAIRRSLPQASDDVFHKAIEEGSSPSAPPPRLLYSSGSQISIGTDIKRYRDHYRHSAYSRSPPLWTQSTFMSPTPGPKALTSPDTKSPSPKVREMNRSMPELEGLRRSSVKVARAKYSSTTDPEAAEGVHASPRRTSIFRVPNSREPFSELRDLPNLPHVKTSPGPHNSDVSKAKRKSSSSMSSLIPAKGLKRKHQAPWKIARKDAGDPIPDTLGPSKSSHSVGVARRLTNARKGGGSTKTPRSSGGSGKEEPVGGRTLNLLKELSRQQERQRAGVSDEPDDTTTSGGHTGETTFPSLIREAIGLATPGKNHDRTLNRRDNISGERIIMGRRRLAAKL